MRVHLISADASGRLGGALQSMLLDHFPNVAQSQDEADVVIVPIDRMPDYKFNPELLNIKKPWVLLDYTEVEWNYFERHRASLLFGELGPSGEIIDKELAGEWHLLHEFCRVHPPTVYFKRELLEANRVGYYQPIDWPCYLEIPPVQSEAEFNARPIEVFHCWGYSHPSRPRLHGQIFEAMATKGIEVADQLTGWHDSGDRRLWYSVYSPYWRREHIEKIMAFQSMAKLSVSLPGAGIKSFRHGEAPVNCIMALPFDDLAWSYDWVDGENCIRLIPDEEFDCLNTSYDPLYPIYLASQETIRKYQSKAYIENYITPIIEGAL